MRSLQRLNQLSAHLLRTPAAVANRPLLPGVSRNHTAASSSPPPTSFKATKKDRAFYPYALDIQSRWADNDQYGHLNNAHYYSLFDTVINTFLIQETGLDPHNDNQGNAIGVVAESGCQYFSSLSFPDMIEARLAVTKLGRSSVVYQVGIFKKLTPSEAQWATSPGSSPTSAGVFSKAATSVLEPVHDADIPKVFHASQLGADVAATGHFCHVFVDSVSRRPVPIPDKIRAGLEKLQVTEQVM
ncbi:HotDog domain-containing protein [Mortierella sp. GBAus27b]|nr:hypothetical protein BGX31_008222 [Mortierella sp. GBA43]KAI8358103.1 HotDog domain-containing protein [Mortierella sp. GBAus27b]